MASNARIILYGLKIVSKYPTISAIFVGFTLILQLIFMYIGYDNPLYFIRILFAAFRNILLFPGLGYLFIYYWNLNNLQENSVFFNLKKNQENFYEQEIDLKNSARLEKSLKKTRLFSKSNTSFNQIRNYGVFAQAIRATINITVISAAAGRTALVTTGGSAVAAVIAGGFEADRNMNRMTDEISNINRNLPETSHSALKQVSMHVEAEAKKSLDDYYTDAGSGMTIKGVNRLFGADKLVQPMARAQELAQA